MSWPTPEHVKTGDDAEWPRWVAPHESHVLRKTAEGAPAHVSVPDWPEFHVDREGNVTVLVQNEDEEARALAEKVDASPADEPPTEADAPAPPAAPEPAPAAPDSPPREPDYGEYLGEEGA